MTYELYPVVQAERFASKDNASPLASGTLFTFTGTIKIMAIVGRVTTGIQNQVTNCRLSLQCDALAAVDLCTDLNIQSFAAGSLLSITGTPANPMVGTTGVGLVAPAQAGRIYATCVTSGIITVTYGAASTGAITWEIVWRPISMLATLV